MKHKILFIATILLTTIKLNAQELVCNIPAGDYIGTWSGITFFIDHDKNPNTDRIQLRCSGRTVLRISYSDDKKDVIIRIKEIYSIEGGVEETYYWPYQEIISIDNNKIVIKEYRNVYEAPNHTRYISYNGQYVILSGDQIINQIYICPEELCLYKDGTDW